MEKVRQDFEAWCKTQTHPNFSLMPWPRGPMREDGLYDGPIVENDEYYAPQTQAGWIAWQAAYNHYNTVTK